VTITGESGAPLLRTIRTMTTASLDNADLPDREVLLVRLACLIALDATRSSYAYNLAGTGFPLLTAEEVESVLTAAAPLVGTARIASAAECIAEAMGYAISVHDLMARG
jgi:alkylhydroperoxidase/carboxymuconolactone decarboxylase family protein YurZ